MSDAEKLLDVRAACHLTFPRYVVFEDGSVVSHILNTPRKLKPIKRGKYLGFTLSDKNRRLQPIYLHRLITETFHGIAPKYMEVRHLDGNRWNNAANNLAWGTRIQNMQDKKRHGTDLKGEFHPMAKLNVINVKCIRAWHKIGISPKIVMEFYGISRMTHWRIVTRKLWTEVE